MQMHRSSPAEPSAIPAKAREALTAAFEAMSTWRNDVVEVNETHSKRIVEKMSAAAIALGWPDQIVDAVRTQVYAITDMQAQTIGRMVDAWEEQLKVSQKRGTPMVPQLKSWQHFGATGGAAGAEMLPAN